MKRAQLERLEGFALLTSRYLLYRHCQKLIGYAHRIYPKFATYTAHPLAAILELVGDVGVEFQGLHGLAERLQGDALRDTSCQCRI